MRKKYVIPEMEITEVTLGNVLMVSNTPTSSTNMTINTQEYEDLTWEY